LRSHPPQRRTKNTITNPLLLREELAKIRSQGYGVDSEEIEVGLKCVAAPVRGGDGTVIAAVSLSGPKERIDAIGVERLSAIVMAAGRKISDAYVSKELGRG